VKLSKNRVIALVVIAIVSILIGILGDIRDRLQKP